VLAGTALLLGTAPFPPAGARAAPAREDVLGRLQMVRADRQRLENGRIASYPVTEGSERELAGGLAALIAAPIRDVGEALAGSELIAQDTGISTSGVLPSRGRPDVLPGVRFTAGERDEVDALIEAAPGPHFNLAPAEIEALRSLRSPFTRANPPERLAAVSDAYRMLLRERWLAYRQGGLAAVAPYARAGGALTDPAADLTRAAEDAARLAGPGATLRDTLLRYPTVARALAVDRFYWIKRSVQRRPMFSLLHQMVEVQPEAVLHVERYFFVGHSYNAAQMLTVALAQPEGSLLISTSRISTDEVLGLGNQLKRAMGRRRLEDDVRGRLDRFRAALMQTAPAAPIQVP